MPGIMVLDGHSGSRCVDHLVERLLGRKQVSLSANAAPMFRDTSVQL